MPTRTFTPAELAAIGVPPDSPEDVEYSDILLADEPVTTLKYTQHRRCIFRAEDDGKTYAVEYEGRLDTGDYEVGGYAPDDHGWYGDTVEATQVEQREVTVTRWAPVEEAPNPLDVLHEVEAAPRYELVPGCPHCPDGHTPPTHGQPWGAYVGPERDGDGQPVRLYVERVGGAHVAESDAQWVRDRLNAPTD
ncbi:hypothetical protein [Streptomyces hygroscopicus]|uniref:hypothetical protein n=1 Tax=Streptomyces hygroscopicus TaxID=1912 RepID=UPI0037BA59E2